MRSEFEKYFKTTSTYKRYKRYWSDDQIFRIYDNSYADYSVKEQHETWQHQQSKVDELQKQLIDQGQRFNEQAQRVKDLEHKNGELQKQKSLQELEINQIAQANQQWQLKCGELQKRVDAVKQLIKSYKDEEKELELKEWEQSTIYGRVAIELEQALKGGSDETN